MMVLASRNENVIERTSFSSEMSKCGIKFLFPNSFSDCVSLIFLKLFKHHPPPRVGTGLFLHIYPWSLTPHKNSTYTWSVNISFCAPHSYRPFRKLRFG